MVGLFISTLLLTPKKGGKLNKGKTNAPEPIVNKLIDGRFISFFIAGLLLQISFAPYYGFFALFLRDFDYSGVAVGLFIALGAVAEIIAFIYMGSLFKRFTLNSLLVFSLAITALRWFLMPVLADSGLWLAINQLSHAASFAIYHSASMKFISSHFTKSQQSRGQGVYLGGVYGVGGAVGAYITGLLWLGGEGASNAFIMAGTSALLGAIIMVFSKK